MSTEFVWRDKAGKLRRASEITDSYLLNIIRCLAEGRCLAPSAKMAAALELARERGLPLAKKTERAVLEKISMMENIDYAGHGLD